jgi:effector-binding domain-containing protein
VPATIRRLLDPVWAFLRTSDLVTHHNVVVYRPDGDGRGGLDVEVGVQVDRAFDDAGAPDGIRSGTLPATWAARATHVGPYDRIGRAHDAVLRWCDEHGHEPTGLSWEIYGDWNDDVDLLETEVVHEVRPLRDPPS